MIVSKKMEILIGNAVPMLLRFTSVCVFNAAMVSNG